MPIQTDGYDVNPNDLFDAGDEINDEYTINTAKPFQSLRRNTYSSHDTSKD